MEFSDVVSDLAKMEGLCLKSIRPGADIIIEKVDAEQNKITIRNSSGKVHNRYFVELQRIWDALLSAPMIRVEDILNGSGSSRNQPETIFANLPYIEWLKVNTKKHIAYIGQVTHPYGTLRQMDPIEASELLSKHTDSIMSEHPTTLVVTANIATIAKQISDSFGIKAAAISEGIYQYDFKSATVILARADVLNLPVGTYCEVKAAPRDKHYQTINLAGKQYSAYSLNELNVIVPQ